MQSIGTRIKSVLQKNKGSVILWMSLPTTVFVVYHAFSDGDFSFLLTVGSIIRGFAFFLLAFKILSDRSARDLSQKSLTAYAFVFAARLSSILFQQGYLPFDRSGDWFYQACELFSLSMSLLVLYLTAFQFRGNYNAEADNFGVIHPSVPGVALLIVPCLLFAMLVHATLNSYFLTDTAWAFAEYLETFAVVPQMAMIRGGRKKTAGVEIIIEPYTAHWMFSLALARLFHIVFWLFSYQELNAGGVDAGFFAGIVGFIVMAFQILQLVIMMDYIYYYLRSAARGETMKMPTSLSLV